MVAYSSSLSVIGSLMICNRDKHTHLGSQEIDPCDLFRVSFHIPLDPLFSMLLWGPCSSASGLTSSGSEPPGFKHNNVNY